MKLNQMVVSFLGVSIVLALSLFASVWFNQTHIGWLIESVPNSQVFNEQWQSRIDQITDIQHPAVIHYLPDNCLCRALASKHAGQISQTALENGFNVFQLGSENVGSAVVVNDFMNIDNDIAPIIAITHVTGQLAYLGAYSDGVRCNTGNSMVESFLESPETLPQRVVIGLDVETCRCTE